MRNLFACALACALLFALVSRANAGAEYILFHHHHHIYKPLIKPLVSDPVKPGGGGSNWTLCPTPAGIIICAITVGIIVHEVLGPKCAKPGLSNGYDTPTLWRPLCSDPQAIAVRG